MVGITREWAFTSIGYPLTRENVSLDAAVWRVWRSTHEEYDLHFRADGRVASISGDDRVTSQVVYRPGAVKPAPLVAASSCVRDQKYIGEWRAAAHRCGFAVEAALFQQLAPLLNAAAVRGPKSVAAREHH